MRLHVPPEEAEAFVPFIRQAESNRERREFRGAMAAWDRAVEALARGSFSRGGADQLAWTRLARAELAWQLGRWDQVLEDAEAITVLDGQLQEETGALPRVWTLSSMVHVANGHYRKAEALLEQARDRLAQSPDPLERAPVLLELGALHNKIGQHAAGQAELEEARNLIGDQVEEPRAARAAVKLAIEQGLAAFRQGFLEEARSFTENALALARQHLPRTCQEADAHRFLAIVSSVQGFYVEALRGYLRALEIYREQGSLLGQTKVYGSIGQSLLELSRVDEALFALNRARTLAVKLGADTQKASLYGKLGTIYREREDFDKAVEYHLKDVELARRFGNDRALGFAFRNLGLSYRARGEGDEARSYLFESLERFAGLGDHSRVVMLRLDLAEVWLDGGHFMKAEEQFQAVRSLLEQAQPQGERARMHLLQGVLHRELRRTSEAERELTAALQILTSLQPSRMLVEVHFELARLYQTTADSHRAVSHLKMAQGLARQLGLNRLRKSVVGLLEQINELELVRLIVQEIEREQALARLTSAGARPRNKEA